MASTYPVLAQRFRRAGTFAYTIAVPVADLGEILPIPDPAEPFEGNRRVDAKHADEFGQYWMRATTWTAPPILVDTARDLGQWFSPIQEVGALPGGFSVGTLSLPRPHLSGLQILDGQHRVLGWMRLGVELTQALSVSPERAEFATRALERMAHDRVTIEVVEALEIDAHKQYFFDIAANARGISVSLASSFDQHDPVRLAAQALAEEHPLLLDRVDREKDRALAGSTALVTLKSVVDLVEAAMGGTGGVRAGESRTALDPPQVADTASAALDALLDEFSDLGDVVEGEVTPAQLRTSSLLGSVTVWRALVSSFHEIAVQNGVVDEEGERRARAVFRRLSPQMALPINDFWWTSGAFAEQASRSPGARRQDVEALVTAIVALDTDVDAESELAASAGHVDGHILGSALAGARTAASATRALAAPLADPDVPPESDLVELVPSLEEDLDLVEVRELADEGADQTDDLDEIATDVNLLGLYMTQAAREPLLTAEEEIVLARRIEVGVFASERLDSDPGAPARSELQTLIAEGERARDRFICANLRLVLSVARGWGGREVDLLDRIQLGNLGLIRGVQKFDFTAGNKFSTYATWWIRQSISRGVADEGRSIRLPVHVVDSLRAIAKARQDLSSGGHDPSDAAVAAACNLTEVKLQELRPLTQAVASFEGLQEQASDLELTDLQRHPDFRVNGSGQLEPDEVLESDFERIWDGLTVTLDARQMSIVLHRFGLDGEDPWTLDALGEKWGVTRERVRQIEKKTLEQMRADPALLDSLRGFRDVGWVASAIAE